MSSLRFTKPLQIKGLPIEAADEWVGLSVGLASIFPYKIGYLGSVSIRVFDEETKTFNAPEHLDLDSVFSELDKYLWISKHSLIDACKYENPERTHLLRWLESGECERFDMFAVDKSVAEYLP